MELDELHVHQVGAGVVGERVAVAGVFPAVARDLVGAADAAGRQHDRLRPKQLEAPALALVAERADDAVAVLEQPDDRALHVHVDPLVDAVILQRADHLEAGAVADVGEARIAVAAEVALQDACRPSSDRRRAPQASSSRTRSGASFACSSAMRQLFTYWPPRIVSAKWTFQLSRSSTLASAAAMPPSAITVCALPSSDLQTSPTDTPAADGFDGRPQPRAAGADDEHVVFVGLVFRHLQDPDVRPHAHRAEPDVQVTEADREQAAPGPQHVPPVEAAHARVRA